MTKIDLITGFLGSGKTTFLRLYARYLLDKGYKIGILENDYGAVNVDMMLLGDLEGDNCELEMVAGACDKDCHIRRFKTKLIALGMSGLDRVIVEPSGIFDVDEFFDVLHEEPLNRMYEIGSVISIVDAKLDNNFSDASNYYLASQIANSGVILLSRTQLASSEDIKVTVNHLKSACLSVDLDRDITPLINTRAWEKFDDADFNQIADAGYHTSSYVKTFFEDNISYSSVYFLDIDTNRADIENKIKILMSSEKCGNIFRIKGFFLENGIWYEVNATKSDLNIMPITIGQKVVIVIGENLCKDKIEGIIANN